MRLIGAGRLALKHSALEAFKRELILDGEGWMEMIVSRNKSAHTYHQETADEIVEKTVKLYHGLFAAFAAKMQELIDAGR